ncbi:MAG: hypothetical protein HUK00_03370 [Bacteroidaceae bacterium]|nr:hypothetical protein [Bacteroidaceae bacterium]
MARTWLHNRFATSELTLPLSLAAGLALWLTTTDWHVLVWLLPMALVGTFCFLEMNIRLAFIRVRTRILSSLFWFGLPILLIPIILSQQSAVEWQHAFVGLLVPVSLLLFLTYDRHEPVSLVFHIFAMLGVVAVVCPPLAVCIPLHLLHLIIYMRVRSARVFAAAFLGLLLVSPLVLVFPIDLSILTDYQFTLYPTYLLGWGILCLVTLVAANYYLRQSYDDKISIRMMYHVVIWQWLVAQALALAFPTFSFPLLIATWVYATPLISHQIALSRSRLTTWWFVGLLLACVAIQTIHQLDIPILPLLTF